MAKSEPTVTLANELNVRLLFEAMARIRGEQCGCTFTVEMDPKEESA